MPKDSYRSAGLDLADAIVKWTNGSKADISETLQDRESIYGNARICHERMARLMSAVLDEKLKEPLTASEAALCMMAVKMARLLNSPDHEDSLKDLAGYAALLYDLR